MTLCNLMHCIRPAEDFWKSFGKLHAACGRHFPHFEGMDNNHVEYLTEDEYLSAKLIEA